MFKNKEKNKKTAKKIKLNITKNNFDLSQKYPEYKKFNLQENLDNFYKKYGDEFYIIYNNKKLLVEMTKIILLNNKYYYKMKYIENNITEYNSVSDYNFIISFKEENSNDSYIHWIKKSFLFSGTELVKICLEINRILGAEKTYLTDESQVICKIDNNPINLQFIKLLENNKSFYMKLGFELDHTIFYNKNEINKIYSKLINNLKKIKCETFIKEVKTITKFITSIINNHKDYYENINKISIIILYNFENEVIKDGNIEENFKYIKQINKTDELLKILRNNIILLNILMEERTNQVYFYEFLIYLFKKKCYKYNIFMKYFLKQDINIKFVDTIYSLKTKILFNRFIDIFDTVRFVYYF